MPDLSRWAGLGCIGLEHWPLVCSLRHGLSARLRLVAYLLQMVKSESESLKCSGSIQTITDRAGWPGNHLETCSSTTPPELLSLQPPSFRSVSSLFHPDISPDYPLCAQLRQLQPRATRRYSGGSNMLDKPCFRNLVNVPSHVIWLYTISMSGYSWAEEVSTRSHPDTQLTSGGDEG